MPKITKQERQTVLRVLESDFNTINAGLTVSGEREWLKLDNEISKTQPKYAEGMKKLSDIDKKMRKLEEEKSAVKTALSFYKASPEASEVDIETEEFIISNCKFLQAVNAVNWNRRIEGRIDLMKIRLLMKKGTRPVTDGVQALRDKVHRDIELSETMTEAKAMLSQFYQYDWGKLGVDVPPKIPEFIKVQFGDSTLKLPNTTGEKAKSESKSK